MESLFPTLIAIALILMAVLTLSQAALSSVDAVGVSWREMKATAGDRARTELSLIGTATESSGAIAKVTLENEGSAKLDSFDRWDVLIQYYDSAGDYHIRRLPYTSNSDPGANQWTVQGIYLDATSDPELFEPDILNPGEEVVLKARLSPSVVVTQTMMVVVTPNGISTTAIFSE